MQRIAVSVIAAASLFLVGSAWAESVTELDRFKLWDRCRPADLLVIFLSKGKTDIELTKETIATSVRSRLRAARLYDATALSYLYVCVNVVGSAFSVTLGYHKIVEDLASGERYMAMTWFRDGTGTHGRDSGYVLSAVSKHTDELSTSISA